MPTPESKDDWNITKGRLRQKWSQLTDEDLKFVEGQEREMARRIEKITGETHDAVEKAIKEFSTACTFSSPRAIRFTTRKESKLR